MRLAARSKLRLLVELFAAAALLFGGTLATAQPGSGVSVRLQAVSGAGDSVVWVSGVESTYALSLDSGKTWKPAILSRDEKLELRDVRAVDETTAFVLSSGTGELSRIYKTTDGGASWKLLFVNPDPEGFFDCFDFWDGEHGLLYGDSVGGELVLFETADGETWTRLAPERLPRARPGEGGFAASGTCLVTVGESTAYVGTGAGSSRLLRTRDRGWSWEAFDTPIASGNATSGITSLSFWDEENGVAAGGDIAASDRPQANVALMSEGGRKAQLAPSPPFPGAIYGIAHVPGTSPAILVAVGPGGAAYSRDSARTWTPLSNESYWSVGFGRSRGWMVGPQGRIWELDGAELKVRSPSSERGARFFPGAIADSRLPGSR